MTAALKEWSAAIHGLLDGRQSILLRKGGIHEKRFAVSAQEFLLFPTSVHSHAERVRPEHRELLASTDSTEAAVTVRAAAKVIAAQQVENPDGLDDIADLHIWTRESIQTDRLDFRPKHLLTVLVVQVFPLLEPTSLPRVPEYGGCRSWVELPVAAEYGDPVRAVTDLGEIAQRVKNSVG
ncbi:hypothetical protein BVC93_30000 [Mycobacterium sp. MS1601]|uniref:DUF1802 family protein n=1 Tax=Mycobacterium sp. MS1601 TaxID=1936029 RepID=UPI00097940B0|nr:DUF1802 family protein [Mycobacterium sp. MS1601]AQA05898.1 hypothetical protein BVC93_30000 [Mycobacterium sp. MS1601]